MTNPPFLTPDASSRPILPIRLIEHGNQLLACRTHKDANEGAFTPFVLPEIPASLTSWLSIGGERIWRCKQRCLAALLLVHIRRHTWTIRLPRQHCGRDGVRWLATAADIRDLGPGWRLGGTFQVRALFATSDAADDCVPVSDGVHLVHAIRPDGQRVALVYVRTDSVLRSVCAGGVVGCDWTAAINAAMPRLQLV